MNDTTIRCKMICNSVTKAKGWNGVPFHYTAKFGVVTGDEGEDAKFFAATPAGGLEVSLLRDDAFEVGKAYYVDIVPA